MQNVYIFDKKKTMKKQNLTVDECPLFMNIHGKINNFELTVFAFEYEDDPMFTIFISFFVNFKIFMEMYIFFFTYVFFSTLYVLLYLFLLFIYLFISLLILREMSCKKMPNCTRNLLGPFIN